MKSGVLAAATRVGGQPARGGAPTEAPCSARPPQHYNLNAPEDAHFLACAAREGWRVKDVRQGEAAAVVMVWTAQRQGAQRVSQHAAGCGGPRPRNGGSAVHVANTCNARGTGCT